jgi:hypothetical protein
MIDIGPQGLASLGFCSGEELICNGKQFSRVGWSQLGDIVLVDASARETYITMEKGRDFARTVVPVNATPVRRVKGRSGVTYSLRSDCSVFGFLAGERVRHELAGDGTIAGVFAGSLWIAWDLDKGGVSQAPCEDLVELHNSIQIVETPSRRVCRISINNEKLINAETAPCALLEPYALRSGDLAVLGEDVCIVIGTFSFNCIVRDLVTEKLKFVSPSGLSLRRRDSHERAVVQFRAFNRRIVDVDVACDPVGESLCPFDRIVTVKGLATVRGRDPTSGRFWIETDDAVALNLGVVLLSGDWILVSRTGPLFVTEGRKVNVDHFRECQAVPGDVVEYEKAECLIVGEDRNEGKFILKDIENGKTVIAAVSDPAIVIVSRAGFPSQRQYVDLHRKCLILHTDLTQFRGLGMKPGDVLEFNLPEGPRKGKVIGFAFNEVWVHFERAEGASCLHVPYAARSSSKVVKWLRPPIEFCRSIAPT